MNFAQTAYTFGEGDGEVALTITKVGESTKPVSVEILVEDITTSGMYVQVECTQCMCTRIVPVLP